MSRTSEVPILQGAVLVVPPCLVVLDHLLLLGRSFLARCGAGRPSASLLLVELGLLQIAGSDATRQKGLVVCIFSRIGGFGNTPGVLKLLVGLPDLHAALVCHEVLRVPVAVDGAVDPFPQELVVRFFFAILLWMWFRWGEVHFLRLVG